jgi:hypothetical protein
MGGKEVRMPTDKPPVTFRLSEEVKAILAHKAREYGLSQTAIVEMLIRLLGRSAIVLEEGEAHPSPRRRKGPPP